jgi:hypothetical protein
MKLSAFLTAIALFAVPVGLSASTLTTPSYKITIEVRCPEYYVTCEDVIYRAVNRKSGKSITLRGTTVHSIGADGVTPSAFLGYTFKNGKTKYFVGEDGELRVTRGSKVLVEETGTWRW